MTEAAMQDADRQIEPLTFWLVKWPAQLPELLLLNDLLRKYSADQWKIIDNLQPKCNVVSSPRPAFTSMGEC